MSRVPSIAAKRRRGLTVFTARPFAGNGTSLYVSIGATVQYRNLRVIARRPARGLPAVTKTSRVANVSDPTAEIAYSLPAALASQEITIDVRRHADDWENLTNNAYTQTRILDGSRDDDTGILGTAILLETEIRAGGIVRLRFRYLASPDGLQPVTFAAVRTVGPTSPDDVSIDYDETRQVFEIDTPALSDASPYTYKITATNGAVSIDLLTGITFTADATGPTAPSGSALQW